MAITYEWQFPNFEVGNDNTVKTIHWRYTATEIVGEDTYTASMYGSCAGSEGMDFTAMTKEHAIMCVTENDQSESAMQEILSTQIEEQKNPPTTSRTKDW